MIEVFQGLRDDYRSKSVIKVELPSQASLVLPHSNQMTLRELRDHVRVHNLQAQVRLVTGRSVSYCSKSQLLSALA